MPYKPISRPRATQSLQTEAFAGRDTGISTRNGAQVKSKLLARQFARGVNDPGDQAPPWYPDARSFSQQRMENPEAFQFWDQRFSDTYTSQEFRPDMSEMAPAPESDSGEKK